MQKGISQFLRTVTGFLGSLKLSFFLLIVLGLLIGQRAIIAQKAVRISDSPWFLTALNTLGFDSPGSLDIPFLVVLVLFAINLGFSSFAMVKRIHAKQAALRSFRTEGVLRALACNAEFDAPEGPLDTIVVFFRELGFHVKADGLGQEMRIHAERRVLGLWGVFCFHLTFLIVLLGGLFSVVTRYSGYLELSPGEVFSEKKENYLVLSGDPLLFVGDRGFSFRLDSIDLEYWRPGEIKQRASEVSIFDRDGSFVRAARIEVNSPITVEDMTIYQGSRHGFIAGLEVMDTAGTQALGTVRFRIPEKPGEPMTGSVQLPGTEIGLALELFTEKLGNIRGLESFGPKHMATLIRVASVEQGAQTFRGVVFAGGSLSFEGLKITFRSLKPYTSFFAVRDYGVPVIFTGFVFLIAGLLVTYFWVPETYWAIVRIQNGRRQFILGAATDRYKASFKEDFFLNVKKFREEVLKI